MSMPPLTSKVDPVTPDIDEQLFPRIQLADVVTEGERPLPELVRHELRTAEIQVGQGDLETVCMEPSRDRLAEPPCGARDDRRPPLIPPRRGCASWLP
jgi:hypothetical protein